MAQSSDQINYISILHDLGIFLVQIFGVSVLVSTISNFFQTNQLLIL